LLSSLGAPFEERDITQDEAALAELEKLGLMTTPVTVIGEEVIVGFDQQRIRAAARPSE